MTPKIQISQRNDVGCETCVPRNVIRGNTGERERAIET